MLHAMTCRLAGTAMALAMLAGPAAQAETNWDLPLAWPAGNFHVKNAENFAAEVAEATDGEVQITVHPGGSLGRRLLLKIDDLMHHGDDMPTVGPDASVAEALVEMTRSGLGLTAVVDAGRRVLGIFTDGDLRRVFEHDHDVRDARIGEVMTRSCKTVGRDLLAAEALRVMQEHKINALLVVDADNCLEGVLNMHDLLRARVL